MRAFFILAILIATLGFLLALEPRKDPVVVMKGCVAKTNITAEAFNDYMHNGFKLSEVTENIKCTWACIMKEQGDLQNGVFVTESLAIELKKHMKPEEAPLVDAAMVRCKNVKGSNDCETAIRIKMCLINQHMDDE